MSPPRQELQEPDSDLLARWLAISGLLAASQEMLVRRSGAWAAIALATSDAGAEAILGLLASTGTQPVDTKANFERLLEQANDALGSFQTEIPSGLRQRLVSAHRARNLAIHVGVDPHQKIVEHALRAVVDLRDVAISSSPVLTAFGDVGPVRAVANLLDADMAGKPGEHLRLAADALASDQWVEACDSAAVALERILTRVTPPLRDPFKRYRRPFGVRSGDPEENVEALHNRSERLEAWVLAIGVGLPPAELARLRRTLGEPRWYGNATEAQIQRDAELTIDQPVAEWAVLTVTDIAFRLWQSGSLVDKPDGW